MTFEQITLELKQKRGVGADTSSKKRLRLLIPKVAFFNFELILEDENKKRYIRSYNVKKFFGEHKDYEKLNDYFIDKIGKWFECEVNGKYLVSVDFGKEV